ncbi:MAG: SIR2 family protein [Candidatus Paceibacterota bacterium]|jgi:hypothetical protein
MDKNTIIEWLTDKNTSFLIGAGCSKCAGKPLMSELTTKVVEKLSVDGKKIIKELIGVDGQSDPTVEDLTNQLLQLQRATQQRKTSVIDGWNLDKINEEIILIQKSVVEIIGQEWTSNQHHKDFLHRLSQNSKTPRDLFLLNYDTLIEASLEDLKLSYTDGFRGAENAFFDPSVYSVDDNKKHFNIYKLHGSINWTRQIDDTVRRKPSSAISETDTRNVIYPAEQKYVQTQYGVYEILLRLFRDRLKNDRPNNRLVVLGYSFSDEHINVAIEDGILSSGSNLTVYAFVGKSISEARKKQLKEMADRCDNRFNVFVAKDEYIGGLNQEECLKVIKELDYSRFENIVGLLTSKDHE